MQTKAILSRSLLLGIIFANGMAHGSDNLRPVPPKSPRLPSCGDSFPGTPNWNTCWAKFHEDINHFSLQMQEYGKLISALAAKDEDMHGNHYSESQSSFSSAMGSSYSSVMTHGYTIQASGIPISTSIHDSKIQIKLTIGNFDSFESKIQEHEIEMKFQTEGHEKWAKVKVPIGVKVVDIKVERSSDTILITGPTHVGEKSGSVSHTFHSSASSGLRAAGSPSAMTSSASSMFMPGFSPFAPVPANGFQQFPPMWFF